MFPYFKILNFRSDDVTFLRNAETAIFNKKRERKHNNISCADENNFYLRLRTVRKSRLENDNELQNSRERSELQLLCCYNSCKAVANNGEG